LKQQEVGVEEEDVSPRPVRRGLLWQQKDKFFSRWKERFFILTQVEHTSGHLTEEAVCTIGLSCRTPD
jgi:hypothetical protein